MPLVPEMTFLPPMFTLPLSPRLRRITLSLVQHLINNRSFTFPMTAMMSVRPELFSARIAARGAIALLDPLFDPDPMVFAFGAVFALGAVLSAAAGGVAWFLAFDEVALGVMMVASFGVMSALAVVLLATAGRVAGILSLD